MSKDDGVDSINCGNKTLPCKTLQIALSLQVSNGTNKRNIFLTGKIEESVKYTINTTIILDHSVHLKKHPFTSTIKNPIIVWDPQPKEFHPAIFIMKHNENFSLSSVDVETNASQVLLSIDDKYSPDTIEIFDSHILSHSKSNIIDISSFCWR